MRDQPHKETTKVSLNYDEKFIIKKLECLNKLFFFPGKTTTIEMKISGMTTKSDYQ